MRPKKYAKRERETIAQRYLNHRRNAPKRLRAEYGISSHTLHKYVQEFQG